MGGLISAAVSVVTQVAFTGKVDLAQTGIAFVSGGVSGLLAASGIGLVGSVALNSILGGVTDTTSQLAKGASFSELNPVTIVTSAAISGIAAGRAGPGLKNAQNPLAQQNINLSMMRSMNSANPSMIYADILTDLLSTSASVAAKEVGKVSVKAAGSSVAKELTKELYLLIFD